MSRKTNQPTFKDHPVSHALRSSGYFPLPRLWVTEEDMKQIIQMANRHRENVNRIRAQVHADHPELEDRRPSFARTKPVQADMAQIEEAISIKALSDKEAAWEAFERLRDLGRA